MENQPCEKDVVRGSRVLSVTLCNANQRRPRNLHNRRQHIRRDEHPKNRFPAQTQRAETLPHERDEGGDGGVNAGGEEDGRDDDEEILDHEVDYCVRVADGGRGGSQTEGVADDFEDAGHN